MPLVFKRIQIKLSLFPHSGTVIIGVYIMATHLINWPQAADTTSVHSSQIKANDIELY